MGTLGLVLALLAIRCMLPIMGKAFKLFSAAMVCLVLTSWGKEPAWPEENLILNWQPEHAHASSLVELPNGDFLACWFQGSGERSADDVRVVGARLAKGSTSWSTPFLMADTPGFPDCNPVLHLDTRDRLWLLWIVVRANRWETSVLKYRRSTDYLSTGAPRWNWQDIILLKPGPEFPDRVAQGFESIDFDESMWAEFALPYNRLIHDAAKDPVRRREGWMTRNHPVQLSSGRLILPLYSDGYNMGLAALSDDHGETWHASGPMVGVAGIQPSIIEKANGELVAYLRETGRAPFRVQKSVSRDQGVTWSPLTETEIPNPSASLEVVRLNRSKGWAMVFNDSERRREKLSIALSFDEGESWPYKRVITPRSDGSYPSMIESSDGWIHVTCSVKSDTGNGIAHYRIDPMWLKKP